MKRAPAWSWPGLADLGEKFGFYSASSSRQVPPVESVGTAAARRRKPGGSFPGVSLGCVHPAAERGAEVTGRPRRRTKPARPATPAVPRKDRERSGRAGTRSLSQEPSECQTGRGRRGGAGGAGAGRRRVPIAFPSPPKRLAGSPRASSQTRPRDSERSGAKPGNLWRCINHSQTGEESEGEREEKRARAHERLAPPR